MKSLPRLLLFLLLTLLTAAAHAAAPVVTNVRAAQRTGTKLVDIYYDLADADSATVTVAIALSADGGVNYSLPAATFTGDYGAGVTPGTNKRAVWNAGIDWNGLFTSRGRARVTAEDGTSPVGMAFIPGSFFMMGSPSEPPVHSVLVSDFWMDRFEVTKDLWDRVLTWGAARGYAIVGSGEGVAANHPVQTVSWHDVVKWCNARSAMEGRTPAYYTDAAQTLIYKVGDSNLTDVMVKWTGNGYRLPTEAEWEKAARGGLNSRDYPWGNGITGSQANYFSSGDPYSTNGVQTTPVGYYNGGQVPAGVDMANAYGLYDMAGNVWEWCWDWYDGSYYSTTGATTANTRGPATGSSRMIRGGSWVGTTGYLRCAGRGYNPPSFRDSRDGFRCALGQP